MVGIVLGAGASKRLGRPKQTLPFGETTLLGFWMRRQPRWLHLAPRVCTDVQALLTSRMPNARRAGALSTVIHEALHAYGVANEAMTNCFAVQLVPFFGLNLGMPAKRARYLGTLARNYVRGSRQ